MSDGEEKDKKPTEKVAVKEKNEEGKEGKKPNKKEMKEKKRKEKEYVDGGEGEQEEGGEQKEKRRVGGKKERRGMYHDSAMHGAGAEAKQGVTSKKERMMRRVQYKKRCLNCRKTGHTLAECRYAKGESGICYNCGNPGHSLRDCPEPRAAGGLRFAKCFICGEVGHLSSSCPKNSKGMYPDGGCCRLCGSVYHLKQDCPLASKRTAEMEGLAMVDKPTASSKSSKNAVSGDADIDEGSSSTNPAEPPTKRQKTKKNLGKTVSF